MDEQGYKDTIVKLKAEIDSLEAVIRGLEAEGLEPLVERLRNQVGSIRKLVGAMAAAIDELLVQKTGSTELEGD
jgi:hypothetical protein